jgi:hypothetical protein
MDDNQVAGEGLPRRHHRLAWVAQVQRAYQFYEEAGLLVLRHTCCVIGDSPAIPVGVTGGTSWRHAAGRALAALQPHNVYYAYPNEASPIEITRAQLLKLWAGQPTYKLVQLVGAACGYGGDRVLGVHEPGASVGATASSRRARGSRATEHDDR